MTCHRRMANSLRVLHDARKQTFLAKPSFYRARTLNLGVRPPKDEQRGSSNPISSCAISATAQPPLLGTLRRNSGADNRFLVAFRNSASRPTLGGSPSTSGSMEERVRASSNLFCRSGRNRSGRHSRKSLRSPNGQSGARSAPRLHRFPRTDPLQGQTVLQGALRGDCADEPPLMSTQARGPSRPSGSHVVFLRGRHRVRIRGVRRGRQSLHAPHGSVATRPALRVRRHRRAGHLQRRQDLLQRVRGRVPRRDGMRSLRRMN